MRLDLANHQYAALSGLLQKWLEQRGLFFQCEVLPVPAPAGGHTAVPHRFALNEPVALFADPAHRKARDLRGLLQAHLKSQWQHHRLGLAQLLQRHRIGDHLQCVVNNFVSTRNSGHDQILEVWISQLWHY